MSAMNSGRRRKGWRYCTEYDVQEIVAESLKRGTPIKVRKDLVEAVMKRCGYANMKVAYRLVKNAEKQGLITYVEAYGFTTQQIPHVDIILKTLLFIDSLREPRYVLPCEGAFSLDRILPVKDIFGEPLTGSVLMKLMTLAIEHLASKYEEVREFAKVLDREEALEKEWRAIMEAEAKGLVEKLRDSLRARAEGLDVGELERLAYFKVKGVLEHYDTRCESIRPTEDDRYLKVLNEVICDEVEGLRERLRRKREELLRIQEKRKELRERFFELAVDVLIRVKYFRELLEGACEFCGAVDEEVVETAKRIANYLIKKHAGFIETQWLT